MIAGKAAATTAAIACGLLLLLTACGDDGAGGGDAAGAVTPDSSGRLTVVAGDNWFVSERDQRTGGVHIVVAAGQQVGLVMENEGGAIHNVRLAGYDGEYETADDEGLVTDPRSVKAGQTGKFTFTIEQPGSFPFRCDFHPREMTGTMVVE